MALPDWIDPESAPLKPQDFKRLESIETFLSRGLALKDWWLRTFGPTPPELTEENVQEILQAGPHLTCFRLIRPSELWPENISYGFFDHASIRGHTIPVVGRVQQVLFDQPMWGSDVDARHQDLTPEQKEFVLNPWRDNLREFVWKHLLSSSGFTAPHLPHAEPGQRPLDPYLGALSWHPRSPGLERRWRGAHNHKLYYRRRDNGKVGRFWQADRHKITLHDTEERGPYRWVVLQTSLAGSKLDLDVLGPKPWFRPRLPLVRSQLGVMSQDFLHSNESTTSPDLGGYTFGWSSSPDIGDDPAHSAGFSLFRFQVRPDGRILVHLVHVAERPPSPALHSPRRLASLLTSARLLDWTTQGWSGRTLGISAEHIERQILTASAIDFSKLVDNLIYVWRAVSDWTHPDGLPRWVDQ